MTGSWTGSRPAVLVTDAARGSAVCIIRSLGRAGFPVVAAASDRLVPGFYSRYTAARVRYPNPRRDPEGAVDAILDGARRHSVELLIPVTDEVLLPLSARRDRLADVCRVAMPDARALEAVVDKDRTLELARSLDIPVPRTVTVEPGDDLAGRCEALGWPVVVKPRCSYDYAPVRRPVRRWVAYANDMAELRALVAAAGGRALLQEHVQGDGRGLCLLMHEGRPLAAFQHHRLREVPLTGGASSFRESEPLDPFLYESSVRLLSALRWTGLAMVEFKGENDKAVLMEVNGRVWGSLALAVASGMDFPVRLAELYLNGVPDPGDEVASSYATDVRTRDIQLEMAWIGEALFRRQTAPFVQLPSRRAALAVAARLLSPGDGYDLIHKDDLGPGLVDLVRVAASPAWRRLRRFQGAA